MHLINKPLQFQKPVERAVLFCDIRGQTREVCNGSGEHYLEVCAQLMKQFYLQGKAHLERAEIVEFCGDEIMAIFKNCCEAVDHAFLLRQKLTPFLRRISLDVGFGIHKNTVYYLAIEDTDFQVVHVGKAINVSKRLENLSEGGEITISDSVYQDLSFTLRDAFERRDGSVMLKNIDEQFEIFVASKDMSEEQHKE